MSEQQIKMQQNRRFFLVICIQAVKDELPITD